MRLVRRVLSSWSWAALKREQLVVAVVKFFVDAIKYLLHCRMIIEFYYVLIQCDIIFSLPSQNFTKDERCQQLKTEVIKGMTVITTNKSEKYITVHVQ